MPRANVLLTLQSVGYSIENLGAEFTFTITTSLGGPAAEIRKNLTFKKTIAFKTQPVVIDRVVDVPAGTTSVTVHVDAVEGKEARPDPGHGDGKVEFKLDDTGSGFVPVRVVGRGGDKGKKADLSMGFLLVADSAPERIAALCALLRSMLPVFAAGVPEAALRAMLLRIAWHESGGLRSRSQNGGPARGVYEMQRLAAVIALDGMKSSDRRSYDEFSREGGFTPPKTLDEQLEELRKTKGAGFDDNAIGTCLASSDRCATLAAIAYIRGALGGLPSVDDIAGAGEFWEDHWHITQNAGLKQKFIDSAKALDRIRAQLPESDCGTMK
jgi:hypothetical protein